ncbi:class I SAM-dependent methyltransferase [Candidatus Gottesmanbacteria bacterium]|nr:class I SAM-dependent methyltransferase [Candidatus Gottesmanbacteria bacterium]
MSKLTKRHFNYIANSYDDFKNRNKLYYKTLKNAVKKEVVRTNSTILDIGCATGSILYFLNAKKGVGIDISGEMIKIARKKYSHLRNLKFEVFNIEKKAYKKNKFDYILFNDVIEHVKNQEKTIKNIADSMSVKTILIFSMANPMWEPILMFLEKLRLKMPEGPHFRISENDLISLFKKNNLDIKSKKVYFPSLPFLSNFGLIYVYTIKKTV